MALERVSMPVTSNGLLCAPCARLWDVALGREQTRETVLIVAVALAALAANLDDQGQQATSPRNLHTWIARSDRVVIGHLKGRGESLRSTGNGGSKSITVSLLAVERTLWGSPEVAELKIHPSDSPRSDLLIGSGNQPAVWFLADSDKVYFWSQVESGAVVLAQETLHRLAIRDESGIKHVLLPRKDLSVPAEILAQATASSGSDWAVPLAAFESWLKRVVAEQTPRIQASHVGNLRCSFNLEIGPDGEGTIQEDCKPERRFGLGPAYMKQLEAVLQAEDPFGLPLEIGTDRIPCMDWGDIRIRTSCGSRRLRVFSQPASTREMTAHARAMRIWNALPHDGRWKLY